MIRQKLPKHNPKLLCTKPLLALSSLLLLGSITLGALPAKAKDLIIHNARIVTMEDHLQTSYQAMSVVDGRIEKLGNDAEILSLKKKKTQVIDCQGKLVLPGLHDSHTHLAEGALEMTQLRLNDCRNLAEIVEKTKDYIKTHAELKEIVGHGISLPALAEAPLTCSDLDKLSNKPILLYSEDGHSLWVNSKILNRIDKRQLQEKIKEKLAGTLADGSASGCLQEEAMDLAEPFIKGPNRRHFAAVLKQAVETANSLGITSIQDAHVRDNVLKAYYDLARRKDLNLRVEAALATKPDMDAGDLLKLQAKSYNYTCGNLRARSAKIFLDGVIETGTAALIKPYDDNQENLGRTNLDQLKLNRLVLELVSRHFQVHIHAIGDKAVRMALDAFEPLSEISKSEDLRNMIAHLELVDEHELPRFHKLGVIANIQPYWAFRDPYVTKLTVPKLGPLRTEKIYPFASLSGNGARLAAGSDWTVSTLNPFKAMQVAMTRQAVDETPQAPLNSKEILTLEEILGAYTTGGAYANHLDHVCGTLSPGKYADFIVLDQDITKLPPNEIGKTKVLETYLEGKRVFPLNSK
ncbi:MAG: amidohydrolase [Candidatus Obscuribacter phosphatis]|uniref:Amidohydrolase n=1 Tax=Candidatus Obscuribacter phosphatis TaxID=1906157 RepID=A0A8J7PE66_9BACT|nr:amidohydrolase [Candidatus Obscuribacter phosphatis]